MLPPEEIEAVANCKTAGDNIVHADAVPKNSAFHICTTVQKQYKIGKQQLQTRMRIDIITADYLAYEITRAKTHNPPSDTPIPREEPLAVASPPPAVAIPMAAAKAAAEVPPAPNVTPYET